MRPPRIDTGALHGILLAATLGGQVWMLILGLATQAKWPWFILLLLIWAAVALIIYAPDESI